MMGGVSLGMVVEGSVAVLLAVTIGYCIVLNGRLKRLHADKDMLAKTVADLMQATGLANAAVQELKKAALDADNTLNERIAEAGKCETELAGQVAVGSQLVQKIARITAAAKQQQAEPEGKAEPSAPAGASIEPTSRLHSALQQLAMRPGIGGKAA